MKDTEKPDFEKKAKEYYPGWYGPNEERIKEDGFKGGCENIWNDYVVPERELNTALSESYANLQIRLGESEAEVNRIKNELDKAVELLKNASDDYISTPAIAKAVEDFLKDKK